MTTSVIANNRFPPAAPAPANVMTTMDPEQYQHAVEQILERVAWEEEASAVQMNPVSMDLPGDDDNDNEDNSNVDVDDREATTRTAPQAFRKQRKSARAAGDNIANRSSGPLNVQDLRKLSYLCTTAAAAAAASIPWSKAPVVAAVAAPDENSATRPGAANGNELGSDELDATMTTAPTTGFAALERDVIQSLVDLLHRHVSQAVSLDLVRDVCRHVLAQQQQHLPQHSALSPSVVAALVDSWLRGAGHTKINTLMMGLEAASIVLFLASSPGMDRLAIHEDSIEASMSLMRSNLTKHVLPALNQDGHVQLVAMMMERQNHMDSLVSPSAISQDPKLSPSKKRKRVSQIALDGDTKNGSGNHAKDFKKLYKQIIAMVPLQLALMDRVDHVVRTVPLDDQQVLMLTTGALSALEIDCASASSIISQVSSSSTNAVPVHAGQQLQMSAIGVVAGAFQKYPTHRDTILEDLFPLFLKLPIGKRALRPFVLQYNACPSSLQTLNESILAPVLGNRDSVTSNKNHTVQMITVLILSLIQACVERPAYDKGMSSIKAPNGTPSKGESPKWISGLTSCQTISKAFAIQLLHRCARPKGSNGNGSALEFRVIASNLVDDLLTMLLLPEYPAAEMLIFSIVAKLNHDLTLASTAGNSHRAAAAAVAASDPADGTFLTVAFDLLAKICSVVGSTLAVEREKRVVMTSLATLRKGRQAKNRTMFNPLFQARHVKCYCQNFNHDVFMIRCDVCQFFYHGACVGVRREQVPDEWSCDACVLAQILARERRNSSSSRNDDRGSTHHDTVSEGIDEDQRFVVHFAFQTALSSKWRLASELAHATQCHLARWVDVVQQKWVSPTVSSHDRNGVSSPPAKHRQQRINRLLDSWSTPGPNENFLTDEGINRIILAKLVHSSNLVLSFRKELHFVLKLMESESSHAMRKLSLKSVERTVAADPNLMMLPIITKSVSRRLADDSISVREAAVSLVGSYVVHLPAVASSFHSSLLACLMDVGVSVRKRAIKIFQSLLLSNPRYKGRAEVCEKLLQRAVDPKEEDGVRDLIYELFCTLWMEDGVYELDVAPPTVAAERSCAHGNDPSEATPMAVTSGFFPAEALVRPHGSCELVTPTPRPPSNDISQSAQASVSSSTQKKRCDMAAEQMMEVVRACGSAESLESLLKNLLGDSNDSDKGKKQAERKRRQDLGQQHCAQLVDSLFELLLSIEEERDKRLGLVGKDLAATLQTIVIFTELEPQAAYRHLDTVIPYMKAENGVTMKDEGAIVEAACNIITHLSNSLTHQVSESLESETVARDLVQITYRFESSALQSAVRALSTLARHSGYNENGVFAAKSLNLARTFYSLLSKKAELQDFSDVPDMIRNNCYRALTVLGFLCQYQGSSVDISSWFEHEDINEECIPPKELTIANLTQACYGIFVIFLRKVDAPTKCAALHALGCLFVAQPRLMLHLEHVGLIAAVMSKTTDSSVQIEALKCWQNILMAEEVRIDGGEAQAKLSMNQGMTVSKKISGDQDGNATLFGGVLTNHADRLFEMAHSTDASIRMAVLRLLAILLRQGLVNPNEAIPHLFALQGDIDNPPIRSMALRLLMAEGEKRPDALRQRICAGVKEAYEFQRVVSRREGQVSALVSIQRTQHCDVQCIFGSVFKECISNNKKQRIGLFQNLLSLYEAGEKAKDETTSRRKSMTTVQEQDLPLLSFVSQILAHLPYSNANDPLFIIYRITGIATRQGAKAIEAFANLLRPIGLASSDELDEINVLEDALEVAARSKFPSRTNEARPLYSGDFNISKFIRLLSDAMVLVLLLRLKTFLRRAYNLSETRCLEFDPNANERLCDKNTLKVDISKPFDAVIPPSLLAESGVSDNDALIRLYAEFRRFMRDESNAKARMHCSDDEQEATKVRKRSALTGDSLTAM